MTKLMVAKIDIHVKNKYAPMLRDPSPEISALSEGDRMSVHLSLERLYHVLTDIELAAMILGKK